MCTHAQQQILLARAALYGGPEVPEHAANAAQVVSNYLPAIKKLAPLIKPKHLPVIEGAPSKCATRDTSKYDWLEPGEKRIYGYNKARAYQEHRNGNSAMQLLAYCFHQQLLECNGDWEELFRRKGAPSLTEEDELLAPSDEEDDLLAPSDEEM